MLVLGNQPIHQSVSHNVTAFSITQKGSAVCRSTFAISSAESACHMTTLQSHQEAHMQGFIENLPESLGWKVVTFHQDPHLGPKSMSLATGS